MSSKFGILQEGGPEFEPGEAALEAAQLIS